MIRVLLLIWLVLQTAQAATHSAATTSFSDVQAAYNLCSDGDTLDIPAGSSTWSSTLNVTKAIWMHGVTNWNGLTKTGNAGLTTKISRSGTALYVTSLSASGLFRLSHISFDGLGRTLNDGQYPISIETSTAATNAPQRIRIDHLFLTNGQYFITLSGINNWGVIDHNVGANNDNTVQLNGGSYIWRFGLAEMLYTTNTMVVEDNLFINTGVHIGDMNECIMSGHGIVINVRSNTFDGRLYTADGQFLPYEHHGAGGAPSTSPPGTDDLRGPPVYEISRNYITLNDSQRVWHIRGGGKGAIICSNTVVDVVHDSNRIELTQDDTVGPGTYAGYDQVNNLNIWGNTYNGSADTTISFSDGNDSTFIQADRNYFLHAPDATSGKITWTTYEGSHTANFNSGVANTTYPYAPLVYPHPIVTAQDGNGGVLASYSSTLSGKVILNVNVIVR